MYRRGSLYGRGISVKLPPDLSPISRLHLLPLSLSLSSKPPRRFCFFARFRVLSVSWRIDVRALWQIRELRRRFVLPSHGCNHFWVNASLHCVSGIRIWCLFHCLLIKVCHTVSKTEMDVNSIRDAFDRVTKKQKLSYSKTQEVIDQITREISDSIEKIRNAHNSDSCSDYKALLADLKTKIKEIAPGTLLEGTQKELNVALSKYPKLLEKSFNPDISKAYRNVDLDTATVNYVIASHFYRQGLFDVGDCFVTEAMEPESIASIRSPYVEMYQILEAMKGRNLEPALKWATSNCSKLKANGSDLEVKLHRMQYVEILQSGNRDEALQYARIHLANFASDHFIEIQKLMGCLLWAGKLEQSPYPDLLSPANWDKLAEELTRQFCSFLGQSFESPLGVTVAAGVQALPPLLKYMNVFWGKKQEWQSMKQLPVPVELDDEFQFHSIFVCPVSKEQATDDNPPMLMPCGHVLCKQSIVRMSKNFSKTFKCPYCPTDIESNSCKSLYF